MYFSGPVMKNYRLTSTNSGFVIELNTAVSLTERKWKSKSAAKMALHSCTDLYLYPAKQSVDQVPFIFEKLLCLTLTLHDVTDKITTEWHKIPHCLSTMLESLTKTFLQNTHARTLKDTHWWVDVCLSNRLSVQMLLMVQNIPECSLKKKKSNYKPLMSEFNPAVFNYTWLWINTEMQQHNLKIPITYCCVYFALFLKLIPCCVLCEPSTTNNRKQVFPG